MTQDDIVGLAWELNDQARKTPAMAPLLLRAMQAIEALNAVAIRANRLYCLAHPSRAEELKAYAALEASLIDLLSPRSDKSAQSAAPPPT